MTFRPAAAVAALSLAVMGTLSSNSQAAEVVVVSTVAAKSVLKEIAPAFERDSRHKLVLRFATTAESSANPNFTDDNRSGSFLALHRSPAV